MEDEEPFESPRPRERAHDCLTVCPVMYLVTLVLFASKSIPHPETPAESK